MLSAVVQVRAWIRKSWQSSFTQIPGLLNAPACYLLQAISLFPVQPPVMVSEVTRGVRIRATVVHAPEKGGALGLFAYRYVNVCMYLLSYICTRKLCCPVQLVRAGAVSFTSISSSTAWTTLSKGQKAVTGFALTCVLMRWHTHTHPWTCSIRFSLLPEEEQLVHWPATAGGHVNFHLPLVSCCSGRSFNWLYDDV